MSLSAYAFDSRGALLGSASLDAKGGFNVPIQAKEPPAVELVIGPTHDPQTVRSSSSFSQSFTPKDWVGQENRFVLQPNFFIPIIIWWPWRPIRGKCTGHVRKINSSGDGPDVCPVPFVKVEVFDVDREGCFWPPIIRWWDKLIDRRVIRIPELLGSTTDPYPWAWPGGTVQCRFPVGPGGAQPPTSTPQGTSVTPASLSSQFLNPGVIAGFNPQPDPPGILSRAISRVGELASLPVEVASRLIN